MKRLFLTTLAACLLTFGLQAPAQAGKADDTLVWTTAASVDTADLYYQSLRGVVIAALNMCNGLFHLNPNTHEYEPDLAKSYKWINPTTMDVKLRKGVKFWNGKEFNAKDVAYTLNHARQPDSGVVTRLTVKWIQDVKVVGPYEVHIIAKEPTPAAVTYLADETPIYPDGHYDSAPVVTGAGGERADYGAVKPMCTGPYKLTKFVPGSSFTLVKNENYFKASPKSQPEIGKLVFKTIPDRESQIAALMTHRVDWVWSVLPKNVKQLEAMPGITVEGRSTTRMSFLSLDSMGRSGENPLEKLKVRRAIAYAIDRKAIVKNIVGLGASVLKSMCYKEQFGCTEDVPQYNYDPAKAKKLLAEAGYPKGFDITLYAYRNRPYTVAVMNYLRKIGIRCNLRFLQWKALSPLIAQGKVAFAHLTWGSQGMMDASASVSHYFEFGVNDYTHDEQVRDWLISADHALDPGKRKALYKKALTKIAKKAYFIPLFTYGRIYGYNSELNYTPTPDGLAHFYMASWK